MISAQSVSSSGVETLSSYVPSIWDQLYRHTECTEEGTRNVVAECLGKLCLMSPAALLPKLKASLTSPSALMRTTVVTAMKFTISDQVQCSAVQCSAVQCSVLTSPSQPQPIDQLLRAEIGHFLTTLRSATVSRVWCCLVTSHASPHMGLRSCRLTWPRSDQVRLIPFPDDLGPFLAA